MKINDPRTTLKLLILSMAALIAVQVMLLVNGYNSVKKDFYLTTQVFVPEAFFRLKLNLEPIGRLTGKLLKIKPDEITRHSGEIVEQLNKAIFDYRRFPSIADTLLKTAGWNLKYNYAITLSSFIIYDSLTQKNEIIKNGRVDGKAISFGNLKDTRGVPAFNAFYMKGDNYFVEVRSYIEYQNLFFYLLWRMRDTLIVSLLTTAMIFGVFVFAVKTINKQKKLAEQQSDFINNITHEFNTPLNTISVAGANLKNEITKSRPDEVERLASVILRQNARLQKLIEDVMSASVMEDKGPVPEYSEVNISELVSMIAGDIQTSYCEKGIEVITEGKTDQITMCDEFQITTAIYNILDNAAKYSPEKSKVIIHINSDDKFIYLSVADHGPGIKESEINSIFRKFYRIAPAGNMQVKGLGLGLYFVKKIIDAHSGRIEVKSAPGEGSVFKIFLPLKK